MQNKHSQPIRRDYLSLYGNMRRPAASRPVVGRALDSVLPPAPAAPPAPAYVQPPVLPATPNPQPEPAFIPVQPEPEDPYMRLSNVPLPPQPVTLNPKHKHLSKERRGLKPLLGAGAAVLLIGISVYWAWPSGQKAKSPSAAQSSIGSSAQTAVQESPQSANQGVVSNGSAGANNYQYDPATKTATYTGLLEGKTLFVSEQRQAASVNETLLKKIASSNGPDTEISTSKGKAFIIQPTSDQQVVIFGTGKTLVVINAQGSASTDSWLNYINSFKLQSPA